MSREKWMHWRLWSIAITDHTECHTTSCIDDWPVIPIFQNNTYHAGLCVSGVRQTLSIVYKFFPNCNNENLFYIECKQQALFDFTFAPYSGDMQPGHEHLPTDVANNTHYSFFTHVYTWSSCSNRQTKSAEVFAKLFKCMNISGWGSWCIRPVNGFIFLHRASYSVQLLYNYSLLILHTQKYTLLAQVFKSHFLSEFLHAKQICLNIHV